MPRTKPAIDPPEWSIQNADVPPSDRTLELLADLLLDFHEQEQAEGTCAEAQAAA